MGTRQRQQKLRGDRPAPIIRWTAPPSPRRLTIARLVLVGYSEAEARAMWERGEELERRERAAAQAGTQASDADPG